MSKYPINKSINPIQTTTTTADGDGVLLIHFIRRNCHGEFGSATASHPPNLHYFIGSTKVYFGFYRPDRRTRTTLNTNQPISIQPTILFNQSLINRFIQLIHLKNSIPFGGVSLKMRTCVVEALGSRGLAAPAG